MPHLNGVYRQRYSHRHLKVGHLIQGRFRGGLVDHDEQPKDWAWSSYRAHVRLAATPPWLRCEDLQATEDCSTCAGARRRLALRPVCSARPRGPSV
jgi:hypothetical protein